MTISTAWLRTSLLVASCSLAACGSGGNSTNGAPDDPAANAAPLISGAPPRVAKVGEPYMFEPTAYDPDGDTLTFSIANRPEWATFSPTTGRFAGMPDTSAKNAYPGIRISVTDGRETVSLPAFDLAVDPGPQAPVNTPPTIEGAPATSVVAGNSYDFVPTASDPDGQTLVFSIAGKPGWADFDTITGRLSGTPSAAQVRTFRGIRISVSDGVESAALPTFAIEVTAGTAPGPSNQPPVISGTPAGAVTVGQAYAFRPVASDPDGQSLTFSIENKPDWANFDPATGELAGTPAVTNVGQATNIRISVSDGEATASLPAFAITVLPANNPPQISGSPATQVTAGDAYLFRPTASDPDGQTLSFSIVNRPGWASFDAATGQLSGTPTAAQVRSYNNVSITVSDGAAQASLPPFSIQVVAANSPPVISGTPPSSVNAGVAYSFTPTASDPDSGQTLTFAIAGKPSWANFSSTTGRLSGTPTTADVGNFTNIRISVSDGTASASLPAFAIEVVQPNRPPVIGGSPATSVVAGQPYSFTPTASDPDAGQTLEFSVSGRPSWATLDPVTGRLSGTPSAAQVGSYANVRITVSDGTAQASLPAFTIEVIASNQPPVIGGSPATSVTAGQAYSFTPTASDPDAGQTLTFAIAGKPSWANFSASTGQLSGTPTAAQVGSYPNIRISVSDGSASASLPAFTIQVNAAPNRAPSINGTPSTSVTAGQPYSFTPSASDPDAGQTLTFSITGRPAWANFDTSTGRLWGTPTGAQTGSYSNIRISVSDGTDSASLPAFSITVAAVQTGSATLSWKAPTLNEDGSPITNLQGFRIYYGTSAANLSTVLDVPGAGITTAVVEGLTPATWYFALKAYNTANVESGLSNVASKTIN